MTEIDTLRAAIADATDKLAAASDAIRAAGRSANDIGALASALQRDAQDVESMPEVDPALKAFLDGSFLQRTGYVNTQAAQLAEGCRRVIEGIRNLQSDGAKITAMLEPKP